MSDDKRERRGHFRGKPRPGRKVEVRFRVFEHGQLSAEQRAYTKNIGIGGAFIVTPNPPAAGTLLSISLAVPASPHPLEIKAEVRWLIDAADHEHEHGMGVKFSSLDVDELIALNEYFASLTATVEHDEI